MTNTRNETRLLEVYLFLLMGIVALLIVATVGLFFRMNQLQSEVLAALELLQMRVEPWALEKGTAAPAFTLSEVDGNTVSLADESGQQVLLVFSSVTCLHSQQIYPKLKRFSDAHKNIQVIMISHGTTQENQQVKKKQGFSFQVLVAQPEVIQEYHVPDMPFFYVIDEQGIIAASGFASTDKELEDLLTSSQE